MKKLILVVLMLALLLTACGPKPGVVAKPTQTLQAGAGATRCTDMTSRVPTVYRCQCGNGDVCYVLASGERGGIDCDFAE